MTGIDQTDVWYGRRETIRDHALVENHHDPGSVHLRTYIDERYKLTVYHSREYGELFDLEADPREIDNLWDNPAAQDLKGELMQHLVFAEMAKDSLPMPRISGA